MFRDITSRLTYTVFYACLGVMLLACSKPQTPQEVATSFWQAIESGKPNKVKKYVSAKDQITMESLQNVMPISNISFGKIVIDGDLASVDTVVTLQSDQDMELPINTHLLNENDRWVVDYERTINTIVAAGKVAAVINQFKDIGNAVKEGIGRSVEELEKTLPNIEQELSNMEQQIQQAVPELKSRFENFSRQLEQAFSAPLENPSQGNSNELDSENIDPGEQGAPSQRDKNQDGDAKENEHAETPMPKLTEELAKIEQEILKAVPELKEQIHGFVEQLQQALELPPSAPIDNAETPGKPIEI